MAGLRFNIDADLTRFSQLVKRIQEVRKEMDKLSKFSPKYNKLYDEFKKIKSELDTMQAKFAEIQTALAQVDISKGIVDGSKKIRHETEETSETIKHYADSLSGIKEQLRQVTNEINSMSEAERKSASGENAVKQYASLKAQLKVAADEMRSFAKEQENVIKMQQASDGSLTQLRRQLSLLTAQYDNLSRDLRNGATGKELIVQIQAVTKELNEAEQASMRFYRNVGNYASGWNGLNVQVQQLARELPSLAISMNTFFLAISNNLPMLIDEIKLAKDRLAELKAEGKEGTPVWKQLTKSLLGWQTALVVGITLLSSYGNEIADWVKGLFKAKENIDILKESLKAYNDAVLEGRKDVQGQLTELKLLYDAAVDTAKSTDDRTKAIKKLKDEYPDYFKGMDNESILAGNAKTAYDNLTKSIIANAQARASMDAMTENFSRIIDLEPQINAEYSQIEQLRKEYDNLQETIKKVESQTSDPIALKGNQRLTALRQEAVGIMDDIVEREEKIAKIRSEIYALNKRNAEIESGISIPDLLFNSGSDSTTGTKQTGNKYLDTYQQQKVIRKSEQEISDAITESQLNAQKMTIVLMQGGNAKELAQINANYDTKIAEIRKRERDLLQTLQDAEYERWKQENPDYQKKGLQFTPTVTALPQDKQAGFDAEYSAAYQQQQDDIAKLLQGVLAKYRDFAAQREAIEKQMNDDIAFLQSQRTETNSDEIDRAIQVAKEKRKDALKELSDEEARLLTGNSGFFSRLFSDSSAMTRASLKKVIREAKELTDYLNGFSNKKPAGYSDDQLESLKGNAESIKGIYDALIEKQDELDRRTDYPFNGIVKGFEKLKESSDLAKKALKETDTQKKNILQGQSEAAYGKGVDYLREGAVEASDAVGYLSEQMSALADATGNAKFKEFADQFSAFSQNLQAAGQGAQSGGWIGAIVGGASDMINQTFAAFAQVKAEEYEFEQNRIDFLNELEKLSVTLKEEDYDSIFGVNSIEKAREAYVLALEALRKYEEAVSERTMPEIEKEYKNLGAAIFSGGLLGFGFGKRISEETKTLLKAYEKGYTDLQAMAVKTKDRSGWANFWGKKDEYTALKDLAPQLWDDDGSFNIDAAEAFLETNTQINDEQRKQIQNVIDLKKAYDENISVIDEMLSSTFGNLSEDITDAIFDSVRNGADAWSLFEEAGSEVIDELGRQLVQQMYVQSYLDTFTERMRAAYGLDSMQDTREELASIMKDIFSGLGTVLEGASSAAEDWDKMAEEYGFSIDKETPEQQSASSRGYETMTQDSINELNGRFTALYESNLRIEGATEEQTAVLRDILESLSGRTISEVTSLPSDVGGGFDSEKQREVINNSYSPQINVSFPTVQLDALVSKVVELDMKVDGLVTFGAESLLESRQIREYTEKVTKQIPQASKDITRTIDNKL